MQQSVRISGRLHYCSWCEFAHHRTVSSVVAALSREHGKIKSARLNRAMMFGSKSKEIEDNSQWMNAQPCTMIPGCSGK